jgi:hypothetical protein
VEAKVWVEAGCVGIPRRRAIKPLSAVAVITAVARRLLQACAGGKRRESGEESGEGRRGKGRWCRGSGSVEAKWEGPLNKVFCVVDSEGAGYCFGGGGGKGVYARGRCGVRGVCPTLNPLAQSLELEQDLSHRWRWKGAPRYPLFSVDLLFKSSSSVSHSSCDPLSLGGRWSIDGATRAARSNMGE